MTSVTVNAGACGFTVIIKAKKGAGKKMHISLDTECEMINNMENDISLLDWRTALKDYFNNPVFCSASKHMKHVTCPVTSAILKAIEVEAGLSVPRDVSIIFSKNQ
jgi:hypothetical protein